MTSHEDGAGSHRRRRLWYALIDEWPLLTGCLPTVLLLIVAGLAHWPEPPVTAAGLTLNTALLLGWGTVSARRAGHGWRSSLLTGLADAALGVLIALANALIK